jgi:lipid-binding SYLF domain-containing protein
MSDHMRMSPLVKDIRLPCLCTAMTAAFAVALGVVPAAPAHGSSKEARRLASCQEVLEELLAGEESIPRDLLDKAECVAVVPSVKKLALGFGGRFGKGAVLCRTSDGGFGPPLMISIGGGSFGLQIGGQASDFVFLIMNPKGIDYLMRSQFTLGVDAAVAAGPVGRTGEAGTDLRMKAEILSYSRTRGLFVGLALEGAVVKQDKDANENLYGHPVDPKELLLASSHAVPEPARGLVDFLGGVAPRKPLR